MVKIAASILGADLSNLASELASVASADMVHLDVMDGCFVSNITFGAPVIKCMRAHSKLPFEAHLMINEPERYMADFLAAGSDIITVHAEACTNFAAIRELTRKAGAKLGMAINPGTDTECLLDILPNLDFVTVMSVEPGFAGQKFMPEVLPKVRVLRKEIGKQSLATQIIIDGGINKDTAPAAVKAGADILVSANAIFSSKDRAGAIAALRQAGK